jgi:transposase-like protein
MQKIVKRMYSDEFRLEVVKEYYRNQLGVRTTAGEIRIAK